MDQPFLFPAVSEILMREGAYPCKDIYSVYVPSAYQKVFTHACSVLPSSVFIMQSAPPADIQMHEISGLPAEGYRISVHTDGIQLAFSEKAGAFYGIQTLWQLCKAYNTDIPCLDIEDAPKLKIRGLLMDISRGKIPTLHTLKQIADTMARCKLNHLPLYIDGLSFAYPKHKSLWSY